MDDILYIAITNKLTFLRDYKMKTLLFEGAGMSNTGGDDVKNCRIRTRIENNEGRIIYLEILGNETNKYTIKALKDFGVVGIIDACFYTDKEEDNKKNFSPELSHIRKNTSASPAYFEYTKENLLKFVNKNLNCDFDEVIIDDDLYVFDFSDTYPICSMLSN